MSRFRLYPDHTQEAALLRHCADARFVWNLAVEQQSWWRPGRKSAPGYLEQCRQLTAARADSVWLREGSQTVQQQSLRDFDRAMRQFYGGTTRRPGWRKAGRDEGFQIVGRRGPQWDFRRLNRNWGEVRVPKVGWVRFRWSRTVPSDAKSYRVTRDRCGRWHVAFAVAPKPVPPPGNGKVVGIDLGVKVSAAMSTGEMLNAPRLRASEQARLLRLKRKLARSTRGSNRRGKVKTTIARLFAREADRRKDWAEKASTSIARKFDVIRVEDLSIRSMTQSAKGTIEMPGRNVAAKAALNREIGRSGWGLLVRRIEDKASGRVWKIPSAYTSQRCSACGFVASENRKSQAAFQCIACGFACNADVNAAINIAAGHVVNARGGDRSAGPANREPQLDLHRRS